MTSSDNRPPTTVVSQHQAKTGKTFSIEVPVQQASNMNFVISILDKVDAILKNRKREPQEQVPAYLQPHIDRVNQSLEKVTGILIAHMRQPQKGTAAELQTLLDPAISDLMNMMEMLEGAKRERG